jgi:hypothetical protein
MNFVLIIVVKMVFVKKTLENVIALMNILEILVKLKSVQMIATQMVFARQRVYVSVIVLLLIMIVQLKDVQITVIIMDYVMKKITINAFVMLISKAMIVQKKSVTLIVAEKQKDIAIWVNVCVKMDILELIAP